MRRILTLCAVVTAFAALAMAETFTGRLVDANCMDQQKSATTCNPTSSTTAFALVARGGAMKLDDAGNAKAIEALKGRADRSADPSKSPSSAVAAKITGTKGDDGSVKVDTIEVQ
jgi:hypothetical protein